MAPCDSHKKLLPVICQRYSSKLYDPEKLLDTETMLTLFEAARWAPSSGNGQPWRYIFFPKAEPELFARGLACLNDNNRIWARHASLLILAIAQEIRSNGKFNSKALHDLGLANQNLLLQAIHLGLHCRPMGGFNAEMAIADFSIPEGYRPVAMIAVGYPGRAKDLPDEVVADEKIERTRNDIHDFVFAGTWGTCLTNNAS